MGKKSDAQKSTERLTKLIQSHYPSLPENQRKVADFLLNHLNEIPFISVADVEKRAGVSKATVVRLSQSLGFSGFLEIRQKLLEGVQSAVQTRDRFEVLERPDHEEALVMVARQDVKNINQTINHIDIATFHQVADLILSASRVHTLGLGISSLMSQILAYSLNQVAVKAAPFVHDYETFLEQLPFVDRKDIMVAFSFPPYSKETIDVVRAAAERKIPVIAITDKLTSPITYHSVKVLPIRSQNMIFTNSFSAISVVINAIATEVAVRNKDKAMKTLKEVDALLAASGHYAAG